DLIGSLLFRVNDVQTRNPFTWLIRIIYDEGKLIEGGANLTKYKRRLRRKKKRKTDTTAYVYDLLLPNPFINWAFGLV
ncbi:hypothetical protein ACJX0J_006737, partial [Zea mays]